METDVGHCLSNNDLEKLSRQELQDLSKKFGLKCGNKKTQEIIDSLKTFLSALDSDVKPESSLRKNVVSEWLTANGLDYLVSLFTNEEIDTFDKLQSLCCADLKLMGLTTGKALEIVSIVKHSFPPTQIFAETLLPLCEQIITSRLAQRVQTPELSTAPPEQPQVRSTFVQTQEVPPKHTGELGQKVQKKPTTPNAKIKLKKPASNLSTVSALKKSNLTNIPKPKSLKAVKS